MFARGLDVGQMSSTISDRHLADIDSMSGRCLKTIEARCRPDIGKCRPRQQPDVGKIYRADIGQMSSTISGRHLADIDSMSGRFLKTIEARCRPDIGKCRPRQQPDVGKIYRADIGKCRLISGRLHVCTWARCRPDVVNDIRPMSENHRSLMSETISGRHQADIGKARHWKRHQADIGTMSENERG